MTVYEHQILRQINNMLSDFHDVLMDQQNNRVYYLPNSLYDSIHELAKQIDHADAIYYYIPGGKVLLEPERNDERLDSV